MTLKKLNNKGMTAIEVLVTFVIIVVVVVSMYDGILALKTKETISAYKLNLTTYKNLLTKEIQDDLIKTGLSSVSINPLAGGKGYNIRFVLRDGSIKVLEIIQEFGCDAMDDIEADQLCVNNGIDKYKSDNFSISYGPEGNLTEYPLPNLGHEDIDNYDGQMHNGSKTHRIYSLRINEVDISTANNVFSMHILLYHPDFETKYSINVVAPINYM